MPHINIQMYPGRPDSLKAKAAAEVTAALVRALGIGKDAISVSIEDIPKEEWKSKVAEHREDGGKKLFIDKGESV
jgi:4-oxalocrotonate tautomerase